MKKSNKLAQGLLEYSILISVAAAAVIGMRVYLTRAVQEKYRQAADVYGQGEQYAKGQTRVTDLESGLSSDDAFISCEGAIKHVADLKAQISSLKNRVDNLNNLLNDATGKNLQLETEKAESEKEVKRLRDSAANMEAQAKQNRLDADGLDQRALDTEKEIAQIRLRNQGCLPSVGFGQQVNPLPGQKACLDIPRMQQDIFAKRNLAGSLREEARKLEEDAGFERSRADIREEILVKTLEQAIPNSQTQARGLRSQRQGLEKSIEDYQDKISAYKDKHQQCF